MISADVKATKNNKNYKIWWLYYTNFMRGTFKVLLKSDQDSLDILQQQINIILLGAWEIDCMFIFIYFIYLLMFS